MTEEEETITDIETLKLAEELKAEKDKNLRLMAESENARKRMQKEKQEMMRFAVENVLGEILGPLENFENALGFAAKASEETQTWAQGFDMILTQFRDVLTNHNITPFHSEGCHFDPHLHEALELEETEEHKEGTIIHEFAKGYKCGDRILRPARVKVAKVSNNQEKEDEPTEEK